MQELDPTEWAVVTGAGQGIGRAIALAIAARGCRVLAMGRTGSKLDATARAARGAEIRPAALDIQDERAVADALAQAEATWGAPPRYLVNAAGVLSPSRLLDTAPEALRDTIGINLTATLILTQIVARRMAAAGRGAIVTIGSNSGGTARTALGAYPAAKAGLTHAMRCLGLELAGHGVRCNVVSPGPIFVEGGDWNMIKDHMADFYEATAKTHPGGALGTTQDVANVVAFLASDAAKHVNGVNVTVDGGFLKRVDF